MVLGEVSAVTRCSQFSEGRAVKVVFGNILDYMRVSRGSEPALNTFSETDSDANKNSTPERMVNVLAANLVPKSIEYGRQTGVAGLEMQKHRNGKPVAYGP